MYNTGQGPCYCLPVKTIFLHRSADLVVYRQVFESLDNVQPYLDGLYFKWRSSRVNRKGFIMMLGTDEAQQGEYQVQTDATQAGDG